MNKIISPFFFTLLLVLQACSEPSGVYQKKLPAAQPSTSTLPQKCFDGACDAGQDSSAPSDALAPSAEAAGSIERGPADSIPTPGAAIPEALPESSWHGVKQWGSAEIDGFTDIAVDREGNYVVTGLVRASLAADLRHAGEDDVFVAKFNRDGRALWTRQFGTPGMDSPAGLAVDAQGNIYVAATVWGALDRDPSQGNSDAAVIKLSPAGEQVWVRQIGGAGEDNAGDIALDRSGNIYLTGSTWGNLYGENGGSDGDEAWDVFLAKLSPEGRVTWGKQVSRRSQEFAHSLAVDENGDVYVAGSTTGVMSSNPSETSRGGHDVFVLKYNANGDLVWGAQKGSTLQEDPTRIVADQQGHLYVLGVTNGDWARSNADLSHYFWDYFLWKLSTAGEPVFVQQYGSAHEEMANGLALDDRGGLYVVGSAKGDYFAPNLNGLSFSTADCFLEKLDSNGAHVWGQQWGTANADWCVGLAQHPADGLAVIGTTDGVFSGNTSSGRTDLFMARFNLAGALQ